VCGRFLQTHQRWSRHSISTPVWAYGGIAKKYCPCLIRIVSSNMFDIIFAIPIIIDFIVVWERTVCGPIFGPREKCTEKTGYVLMYLAHVITALYVLEWILRILVYGIHLIWAEWLNCFDTVLVFLCGAAMLWIYEPLAGDTGTVAVSSWVAVSRVLGTLRIYRFFRIFRRRGSMKPIWHLYQGLLRAGGTFIWSIVFFGYFTILFAMISVELLGRESQKALWEDYEAENDAGWDPEMITQVNFKSLDSCIMTMVQIMTLDGWAKIVTTVGIVGGPFMEIFLLLFVFLCNIMLFNLVTASVINSAFEVSRLDEAESAQVKSLERKKEIERLRLLFETLDVDKSGTLSEEEFSFVYRLPQTANALRVLEMEYGELQELFSWLQIDNGDGHGEVDIEEFAIGLYRLKGEAKSKDMLFCRKGVERILERLKRIESEVCGETSSSHKSSSRNNDHESSRSYPVDILEQDSSTHSGALLTRSQTTSSLLRRRNSLPNLGVGIGQAISSLTSSTGCGGAKTNNSYTTWDLLFGKPKERRQSLRNIRSKEGGSLFHSERSKELRTDVNILGSQSLKDLNERKELARKNPRSKSWNGGMESGANDGFIASFKSQGSKKRPKTVLQKRGLLRKKIHTLLSMHDSTRTISSLDAPLIEDMIDELMGELGNSSLHFHHEEADEESNDKHTLIADSNGPKEAESDIPSDKKKAVNSNAEEYSHSNANSYSYSYSNGRLSTNVRGGSILDNSDKCAMMFGSSLPGHDDFTMKSRNEDVDDVLELKLEKEQKKPPQDLLLKLKLELDNEHKKASDSTTPSPKKQIIFNFPVSPASTMRKSEKNKNVYEKKEKNGILGSTSDDDDDDDDILAPGNKCDNRSANRVGEREKGGGGDVRKGITGIRPLRVLEEKKTGESKEFAKEPKEFVKESRKLAKESRESKEFAKESRKSKELAKESRKSKELAKESRKSKEFAKESRKSAKGSKEFAKDTGGGEKNKEIRPLSSGRDSGTRRPHAHGTVKKAGSPSCASSQRISHRATDDVRFEKTDGCTFEERMDDLRKERSPTIDGQRRNDPSGAMKARDSTSKCSTKESKHKSSHPRSTSRAREDRESHRASRSSRERAEPQSGRNKKSGSVGVGSVPEGTSDLPTKRKTSTGLDGEEKNGVEDVQTSFPFLQVQHEDDERRPFVDLHEDAKGRNQA